MLTNFLPPVIKPTQLTLGFGLVELLVSISIMVLVTSVILARHDSFNGATLLQGQAYEVALQAREIQLLAISSADVGAGFRNVYGLYLNTATDGSYTIFRDADDDYFYDSGEEFGKQVLLDPRFEIAAIRLIGGVGGNPDEIAVLFERPNFDAKIYEASGNPAANAVSGLEIDIRLRGTAGAGAGEVRTVEITKTGQIAVKNTI